MTIDRPEWVKLCPSHYGMAWTAKHQTTADGPLELEGVKLRTPFVVAITGAGKGIGATIAQSYAKAGASGVMLSSRTLSDLKAVAANISRESPNTLVRYQVCDVTQEAELEALASTIRREFGRLDAVVLSAGENPKWVKDDHNGMVRGAIGIHEEANGDFFRVWDTNFKGAYLSSRALLPILQETTSDGARTIIFLSSASSLFHTTDIAPFCGTLSKLAVNKLAEIIHESYHEEGINSYAIHPGGIPTEATQNFPDSSNSILIDDISLPAGLCIWLSNGKRDFLSGRYVCANWDIAELEARKQEIVDGDKFKLRLTL
ncbi:hypothetical protein FE257_001912 [Aspergillus nanangensis]|uniref:NAD(P)-binding protein n=1 Tax=Aspergillus nanangensis TaxID=2582783 RepID=A0AAD4CEK4_ASPNN|nr:hypothetical protein FE257_001912 [Aspergillus nanangensis]